jgi:hypothetical protein
MDEGAFLCSQTVLFFVLSNGPGKGIKSYFLFYLFPFFLSFFLSFFLIRRFTFAFFLGGPTGVDRGEAGDV